MSRFVRILKSLFEDPEEAALKRRNYIRDRKELKFIKRIELDLGDARERHEIKVVGDVLLAESIDGEADIYFNDDEVNYVELDKTRKMYMDFWRIFITNVAQAGKTCIILVGRQGTFDGAADIATLTKQIDLVVGQKKSWAYEASDDVLLSNLTEESHVDGGGAEKKMKEFLMLRDGQYRAKFEAREDAGAVGFYRIKIDGVVLIDNTALTNVYVEYINDIAVQAGEAIQIFLTSAAGDRSWIKNCYICGEATGIAGIDLDP